MRNTSSAFRRALYDGNRNYQCTVDITLVDNTELTITNARIAQGGVSLDDNVSDTSSFTALGSAIINALTLQINNVYEEYSEYDFTGADVVLYIALSGVQESPIKICTMTVEKATYNGMIITLECLDNMVNFDTPYTSTLTYPATLQSIVFDACTDCGVVLGTTTFPNYTFEVPTRPNDEALTYREVISYVATLAGCFARCNSNGSLELKWFDKNALIAIEDVINGGIFDEDSPYSTGDTVDGGIFNPWNTGDVVDGGAFTDSINAHYITALASQELGIENVVITGIQITVENEVETEEETRTDVITRTYGTSDYVIKIENNPFITLTNMDTIGAFLQNQLAGLTFRYGTVTHLNDPAIEAGDVAMVWDRKGNAYPLLVTNTQFEVGSYQTTTCSADTPVKNSATRFSALTKSFVQNKEVVRKESNALETRFNQAINAKAGMYETREPVGTTGAYIYYMHDKPNLSDSSAVIKITNEAVAVTPDYQASPIQWYGLTVDGNFIANIMSVIGINFDWGTGGTLTLGGQNNQNGTLTVKDASGNTIGTWDKDGMYVTSLLNITSSDRTKSISLKYEYAGITKKTLTVDPTTNSQTQNSNLTYETLFTTDDLITGKLYSTGLFYSKVGAYIEGTTDLELLNCPQINTLTLYTFSLVAYGLVDGANLKTTGSLYNQYDNTFIRPNVDNWLRINDLGAYSSGVYFGSSLLRTDGYFQVGGANPVTQYRNGSIEFTGDVAKATAPSATQYKNIVFLDNGGRDSYHRLAFIEHYKTTANENCLQLGVYNHIAGTSSNSWPIGMRFSIDSNQSGAVAIWGNTTVSGSLLTSSGRLYARLASGEAQIQADNNGNNKIYMYANSDGRIGIWQMTANGTSGSVISRANNSTMITFGNAAGQVQTYGYNYGAGAPIVSQTDANHRVSHMYCSSTSLLQVCAQTGSSTYTTGLRISLSTSDKRMKENIKDADVNALSVLNQIKMRQFDWNVPQEYQHQNIGMIADEIEQIDPHLASGGGYDEDGNMNVKSIDTFYLIGYLVKAVQELSAKVKELERRL